MSDTKPQSVAEVSSAILLAYATIAVIEAVMAEDHQLWIALLAGPVALVGFWYLGVGLLSLRVVRRRASKPRGNIILSGSFVIGLVCWSYFGILGTNDTIRGSWVSLVVLSPFLLFAIDLVRPPESWAAHSRYEPILQHVLGFGFLAAGIVAATLNHILLPGLHHEFHRLVYLVGLVLVWLGWRRVIKNRAPPVSVAALMFAVWMGGALVAHAAVPWSASVEFNRDTWLGYSQHLSASPTSWEAEPREFGRELSSAEAQEIFKSFVKFPQISLDDRTTNVLLIQVEALRQDQTSTSSEGDLTPRISDFARSGFVAKRAHAASSSTLQSTAALFSMASTSSSSLDVKRRRWRGRVRPEATSIAEIFQRNNYDTFWVGHDIRGHFREQIQGLEQGFGSIDLIEEEASPPKGFNLDERIKDAALAKIDETESPFFGFVFFGGPHAEYLAYDSFDMPSDSPFERYRQEIRNTDSQVGALLDSLNKRGLLENTIVVLTADHGEEFGEHGAEYHGLHLFEESINVPLVVFGPGIPSRVQDSPLPVAATFVWLFSGMGGEFKSASDSSIKRDWAPMLAATQGAVVAELIGWKHMKATLTWPGRKIHYDFPTGVAEAYELDSDRSEGTALQPTENDSKLLQRYLEQRSHRIKYRLVDE